MVITICEREMGRRRIGNIVEMSQFQPQATDANQISLHNFTSQHYQGLVLKGNSLLYHSLLETRGK